MTQLFLKLLGGFEARAGASAVVPEFPRKKATALLAVLASPVGRGRSRDELCGLLWGNFADEQARDSLRQTLFVMRKMIPDNVGPFASGDTLVLDAEHIATDVGSFEAAAANASTDGLERAFELYTGEFLQGFALREDEFESWLSAERRRLENLALSVMGRLLMHYRRASRHDAAIQVAGRALDIDPLQEDLHRTLIQCYVAVGRNGQARQQYQKCAELLERELGIVPSLETQKACELGPARDLHNKVSRHETSVSRKATQRIRFCKAFDGVQIAYATAGQGPPLVKAPHWLTHLDCEWDSPVWRHFLEEFSSNRTLIRFDQRGNGLSDWNVEDISFEAFVRDLEAVVDAAGLDRFSLIGMSQGCPISIAYTALNPDRVSRLILHGGIIKGQAKRGLVDEEESEALHTLMKIGWGRDNPSLRQMYTTNLIPGGTKEQMDWYNELMRISTSPENAPRLRHAFSMMDVTPLLSQVKVPTLILRSRNDAIAPIEDSQILAAEIQGSRFVSLESDNHILLEQEPAWPLFVEQVQEFLGHDQPNDMSKTNIVVDALD
ncbi:alpha/beta fold hydrolase [Candidatus Halocynthiibacter alkanivorans]|uniref:alpha/beta fold hydrolase n=1 Tax=Candidatus Halocynthiibacter alkanivorans TaxID=2267619 RepID=UPI000DF344BF|nr:alpha/beta hydrolase [Candidatus Halocynthiibacter alkanivorans]